MVTRKLKKALKSSSLSKIIFYILIFTAILCTCHNNYTSEKSETNSTEGIIQVSKLFNELEPDGSENVTTRFYTNEAIDIYFTERR